MIGRPAFTASSCHRWINCSSAFSSGSSFFSGWRSSPGAISATSQLDWLISTTTMSVLSWQKGMRDRLKSFDCAWGSPSVDTKLRRVLPTGGSELRRHSAIEAVIGQMKTERPSRSLLSQRPRPRCRQRHPQRRRLQPMSRSRLVEDSLVPNPGRDNARLLQPTRAETSFLTGDRLARKSTGVVSNMPAR